MSNCVLYFSAMASILLVDDDPSLTEVVGEFLSGHGYTISTCTDGVQAVAAVRAAPPDLVVLDLTMPGMDGLTVCRTVRPFYGGKILMLTALIDDIDEVAGLETGADDYVRKPVKPRVLLARIRSLLRRAPAAAAARPAAPAVLLLGVVRIDPGALTVSVGGAVLALNSSEFELLHALAVRAGQVVSRDELYRSLRGIEWDGLDRSMDLRVSRLRSKLGRCGGDADWIKSVRGEGYLMVPSPRA